MKCYLTELKFNDIDLNWVYLFGLAELLSDNEPFCSSFRCSAINEKFTY